MDPDRFWRLTIAEFSEMVDGYIRRQKNKRNELLYLAWHTAALIRQAELPALADLVQDEPKEPHEQTPEEMIAVLRLINAAYGGNVVEV